MWDTLHTLFLHDIGWDVRVQLRTIRNQGLLQNQITLFFKDPVLSPLKSSISFYYFTLIIAFKGFQQ